MKYPIILLAFSLISLNAKTQDNSINPIASHSKFSYNRLKIDGLGGYAVLVGSGEGAKGGTLLSVEPHYALSNKFSVGFRVEGVNYIPGNNFNPVVSGVSTTTSKSSTPNMSYVLTGDYYLNNDFIRPFVSLGTGLYSITPSAVTNTGSYTPVAGSTNNFGGLVRAGLEVKHLRFSVEYNIISNTTGNIYSGNTIVSPSYTQTNSYLSFKIGLFLGGGHI